MSLWEEIRKGTAKSIDPLGIGISGGAQAIAGKGNYEPLIDLGTAGTQVARMVALAVASYFTFGGAAAAAPASSGTVATEAGAGAAGTGAASSAAPITDVAASAAPTAGAASAAPITDVSISAAPAVSAPTVAAAPATASGGGFFNANNAMRAAGFVAQSASSSGGATAPDIKPTPYQRAPQPNGVPVNSQPSNATRPTDTMGGTLATSPQGVTGKAAVVPRLGSRRLLG